MDRELSYPSASYLEQAEMRPQQGRHVLASFDDERVIVYQAYRDEIADYALEHQHFGGPWSFGRMSWIKPSFLWMMYRSGWATKEGQERILAVHLRRQAFEEVLARAVASAYHPALHASRDAWQRDVATSDVRLQWDPDHDPGGAKLPRRAIQLGLRHRALEQYAEEWLLGIEDATPFVLSQRSLVCGSWRELHTPVEHVMAVEDPSTRARLGIDEVD